MSFLDNAGLAYFYNKIKQKFVRSVNAIEPDANGNVAITNVATADNLTSPDDQTSFGTYIYRTSGGDVSLQSGPAQLSYIDGNVEAIGRVLENFQISATNNIIITVDAATWRNSSYGSASNTYTFNYTASTRSWSPTLATYGLSASNVIISSATASISGMGITNATVNKATWETQITTTGSYLFIYDTDHWTYNESTVTLSNYGITIEGTPLDEDTITINYIAATPNSVATVVYTKFNPGTISVAKPTKFSATGFNQYDANTMTISDAAIVDGTIENVANSMICYCKAVGGVDNGYVAYSSNGYITNMGYCSSLPLLGSTVTVADEEKVTSTLASVEFDNDGYVVVSVSNNSDLCIHPKWSGSADTQYAAYVAPSEITFPTTGINSSGQTVTIPLGDYGMPAVGAIADRLNLESGVYTKRIGRLANTASNLAEVEALNVAYDYDTNYIYYVLPLAETYTVEISPIYNVDDFGTEEFIGTTVPVVAQILYGQNLRDKLRRDVELKKLLFQNVKVGSYSNNITVDGSITSATISDNNTWGEAVNWTAGTYIFIYDGNNWTYDEETVSLSNYGITINGTVEEDDTITVTYSFNSPFNADTTYDDFPYRASIPLSGVTNLMIPEIIFNLTETLSGQFAPIVESYNGGIYLYANAIPTELITIPVIICWRSN